VDFEAHAARPQPLTGAALSVFRHLHVHLAPSKCVFRAKSAADSGMKSATDSDLISAIPI